MTEDKNHENSDVIYINEDGSREEQDVSILLDHVQKCSVVFQSQQRNDPDLTLIEKRKIAKDLFYKNPFKFITKFGLYLEEEHLNCVLRKVGRSYEVQYCVKNLKASLSRQKKKLIIRNRRYEAMKRMEATGDYFSETEMEKREPLLYYQMVGQYLNEKEKLSKIRESTSKTIPSFTNFLLDKIEKDEIRELFKRQREEEENLKKEWGYEEELGYDSQQQTDPRKRWGEDWEDEQRVCKKINDNKMYKMQRKQELSIQEKNFLAQEFKSIMQNNFLNGQDRDFNYLDVDTNPDYDSLELRSQDEEEIYFNDETCENTVCTDTGIQDY